MPLGFYIIMAAQFFSALADNALLIVSIALLREMAAPAELEPLLKLFFTLSYVLLAAFVGAFADSMPKWRVMLISNTIKIGGCLMLLLGSHPLLAYAVIGLGAAAYSPAKYGILTEYLPHRLLVVANGWLEGLTVGAIILGTVLGGILVHPTTIARMASLGFPVLDNGFQVTIALIGLFYLFAAAFNFYIPDTGVDHKPLHKSPLYLLRDFGHCLSLLWRDRLGQISLAVTTLFWGAGATLQFIVIRWAEHNLGFDLSQASMLQGVVAIGIGFGSVMAARRISLRSSVSVIPLGIAMGLVVMTMIAVTSVPVAMLLMVAVGALAGFFVVPMNALLQHRGHILMGAGHSIAVQNFNENLSILVMTGVYAVLIMMDVSINTIIVLFGVLVAATMVLVRLRHRYNQQQHDVESLLDQHLH
ncbi:lysophospholipid transporter LplT [Azoarcus taiwanensis]|uniref:Lysophospholipid transporter LplT n=1 Tax=Azoarcus taiwanensis TaxID=666964 RepID=A0A972FD62_9RHOO|nr:lysophospholipid transporter LplT [Azoarcus taiwanensis]NMG03243.1 lysophospholipid transporter LplT [Azoarcus taiwanensis]